MGTFVSCSWLWVRYGQFASSSCLYDFPSLMDYNLELEAEENFCFPLLLLVMLFYDSNREKTRAILKITFQLGLLGDHTARRRDRDTIEE